MKDKERRKQLEKQISDLMYEAYQLDCKIWDKEKSALVEKLEGRTFECNHRYLSSAGKKYYYVEKVLKPNVFKGVEFDLTDGDIMISRDEFKLDRIGEELSNDIFKQLIKKELNVFLDKLV